MKIVKVLLLALAAVFALVLIATGLAFVPAIQKWAVLKAANGQPGMHLDAASLSATPGRLTLQKAVLDLDEGMRIVISDASVDYSLWQLVVSRNLVLGRVEAKGIQLDLTRPPVAKTAVVAKSAPSTPSPVQTVASQNTPAPVHPFDGVMGRLKLPMAISMESCLIEGEALYPQKSGQPAGRARYKLSGSNLRAGQEARFEYEATAEDATANAPVSAIASKGTLIVAIDSGLRVTNFRLEAAAEAQGASIPKGASLKARIALEKIAEGESCAMNLESWDGSVASKLLDIEARYTAGNPVVSGRWKLAAKRAQVEPFALGRELPDFDFNGQGVCEWNPTAASGRVEGIIDAMLARARAIDERLAALPALRIRKEFDVSYSGTTVRLNRLSIEVADDRPVLAAKLGQPVSVDMESRVAKMSTKDRDLLQLVVHRLPMSWMAPFVPGLQLRADDFSGEFMVSAKDEGVEIKSVSPATLGRIHLQQDNNALLKDVTVSMMPVAEVAPQGWQVRLGGITVKSGGQLLFAGECGVGQIKGVTEPVAVKGRFEADVAGWLKQPAAAGSSLSLARGRVTGDLQGNIGDTLQIQTRLSLLDLVAAGDPRVMPRIETNLRADRAADGKISFSMPVSIISEKHTGDIKFEATALESSGGWKAEARATSEKLLVDDLLALLALTSGSSDPAPAVKQSDRNTGSRTVSSGNGATHDEAGPRRIIPELGKPAAAKTEQVRDAKPFWSGVQASISMQLKSVVTADDWRAENCTGIVRIEADRCVLENVNATCNNGGGVTATAELLFSAVAPQPYVLTGKLNVSKFDSAPLFRAFNPSKQPVVEGNFDIVGRFDGKGINASDLAEKTRGEFKLESKGGIFRALSADVVEKVKKTQGTAAFFGSLLGAISDKDAERSEVIVDVANALGSIKYDQMSVWITRDDALNLRLNDFSLLSPDVRLGGTGEITHQDGVPILRQALDVRFQFGARGVLAEKMGKNRMLDGRKDSLGYMGFALPLRLTGSIDKPDTSEITNALLKFAFERN